MARHSRRSNQVSHFELSTQVAHSAPLSSLAGCNQITGFEGRDLARTDLTRKHLKRTDLVPSAADSIVPGRSHHLNYSSLIIIKLYLFMQADYKFTNIYNLWSFRQIHLNNYDSVCTSPRCTLSFRPF